MSWLLASWLNFVALLFFTLSRSDQAAHIHFWYTIQNRTPNVKPKPTLILGQSPTRFASYAGDGRRRRFGSSEKRRFVELFLVQGNFYASAMHAHCLCASEYDSLEVTVTNLL